MAKAKRKPRPQRQRSLRPELGAPAWLTQLRAALFTRDFPALDPHYQAMDGTRFVCERALLDDGIRLLYREFWRDPETQERVFHWSVPLDVASFMSVPPLMFTRAVETLRQTLQALRPAWPVWRVPRKFILPHERLGRQPGGWQ